MHDPDEEPECETPIDWGFDDFTLTKKKLRELIYQESIKIQSD